MHKIYFILIVTVLSGAGCSTTRNVLNDAPAVVGVSEEVAVQRWPILEKQRVVLSETNSLLGAIVQQTSQAEFDGVAEALRRRLANSPSSEKGVDRDAQRKIDLLNENVISLTRQNQTWFFPKPMLLEDEIYRLKLRPGDLIGGMNYKSLPFSDEKFEVEQISVSGKSLPLAFNQRRQFGSDKRLSTLMDEKAVTNFFEARDFSPTEKKSAEESNNISVISRRINGRLFHLVLPSVPRSSFLKLAVPKIVDTGVFREGDNVTFLNFRMLQAIINLM